ncbi:MAG: pentapeptide repeat-containing protein [Pseudomonadota bacterium]
METDPKIARINEISTLARTAWFTLMAYLVFAGITLLGVNDADFFVPSRQTELPLVGVQIPTASFFWTAPILGAALYTYLHLFLIKLWEAHAEASDLPTTGLHNWLVNDFALRLRQDPKALKRPLGWLTGFVTRALVWAAGPIMLAYFWWRSMPAHSEWMTLLAAVCLGIMLIAGFTSWWTAWALLRRGEPVGCSPWRAWWRPTLALLVASILILTSWLRTEGGLVRTAAWTIDQADIILSTATPDPDPSDFEVPPETRILRRCDAWDFRATGQGPPVPDCFDSWNERLPTEIVRELRLARIVPGEENLIVRKIRTYLARWLRYDWLPLARTDLASEELVALPGNWRTPETARKVFRVRWCRQEALPLAACDHLPEADRPNPPHVERARNKWCETENVGEGIDCDALFADYDTRFETDWSEERGSTIANLPALDLARRDLRRINAQGAFLAGADLQGARMEGADLWNARMEGANLQGARMEGAELWNARMEGANLQGARMEGADLWNARMEGAELQGARMERAALSYARLEGAELQGARMEGAILSRARMEGAELQGARMEGAILREARMEGANLQRARMVGADLRDARMEGANLFSARMEGANLQRARMEGANLWRARMEGANLWEARMEGANLRDARIVGADLRDARMEGADLWNARMEGAILWRADLRSAYWAAAHVPSAAQDSDFRGGQDLLQEQLDQMIGNAETLLPETLDAETGRPFSIPTCWPEPPEAFVSLMSSRYDYDWEADRIGFRCPYGPPSRTGTPCALDLTRAACLNPARNPHHPQAIGPFFPDTGRF